MYTNDNWYVILLSCVYFGNLVTKICHFSPLKNNNRAQLRTSGDLKLGCIWISKDQIEVVFKGLRSKFLKPDFKKLTEMVTILY